MEDCGVNMLDDRLTDTESGRLASICWSISSSYGHTLCVSSAKYSNQISWTVGNFLSFSFIFSSTSSIPSNSLTLVELFWANLRGMYSAELPESNFIFSFRMNSKFRLAHPRKWKTRVTPIISSVWLPPSFWSVGEFLFRRLDAARCRHLLPLPGGFCWLVPIIKSVMSTKFQGKCEPLSRAAVSNSMKFLENCHLAVQIDFDFHLIAALHLLGLIGRLGPGPMTGPATPTSLGTRRLNGSLNGGNQ